MTIGRGEGGEEGVCNYLVLCSINELHHQLLFLKTFGKESGRKYKIYAVLVLDEFK